MALPWVVPLNPIQGTDSPGLGPQDFNALWQVLSDMFGVPQGTPINGNLIQLGTNVDGKLSLLPVAKALTPFLRLIGTEASAADVRLIEEAGVIGFQVNRGTESGPTWADTWRFGLTAAGAAAVVTAATMFRVYTFPDKSGTLAMLDDTQVFPVGTVIAFFQATVPVGWTRVVDAPNTGRVVRLLLNNEVPGVGGSWTITGLTAVMGDHVHEIPSRQYMAGDPLRVDVVNDAFFTPSGNTRTLRDVAGSADIGDVVTATVNSGPTDLGTIPVLSDGTWRPAFRDAILGQKAP